MTKTLKDLTATFIEAFAGSLIATTAFLFCKVVIVHHNLHLPSGMGGAILIYSLIYAVLFAGLNICGRPTWATTLFTSAVIVAATTFIAYWDEKFASFTVNSAVYMVLFALLLSASTSLCSHVNRAPLALGKS